jgi:hypothetical protein
LTVSSLLTPGMVTVVTSRLLAALGELARLWGHIAGDGQIFSTDAPTADGLSP